MNTVRWKWLTMGFLAMSMLVFWIACTEESLSDCGLGQEKVNGVCQALNVCQDGYVLNSTGNCVRQDVNQNPDDDLTPDSPDDAIENDEEDDTDTTVIEGAGSCADPYIMNGDSFEFPESQREFKGNYLSNINGEDCLPDTPGGVKGYGYEAIVKVPMESGESIRAEMYMAGEDVLLYVLEGGCYDTSDCLGHEDSGQDDFIEFLSFTAPRTADYYVVFDTHEITNGNFSGIIERITETDGDTDEDAEVVPALVTKLEIPISDLLADKGTDCGFETYPIQELAMSFRNFPNSDTFFFMTDAGYLSATWNGAFMENWSATASALNGEGNCNDPAFIVRDRDFNGGVELKLYEKADGIDGVRRLTGINNCGTLTSYTLPSTLNIDETSCLFSINTGIPRYYICDRENSYIYEFSCTDDPDNTGSKIIAQSRTLDVGLMVSAFTGITYSGTLVSATTDGAGRGDGISYTGKIWVLIDYDLYQVVYRISTVNAIPEILYSASVDQKLSGLQYHREVEEQRFYGVTGDAEDPNIVIFSKNSAIIR